jgi:hypothetical protein
MNYTDLTTVSYLTELYTLLNRRNEQSQTDTHKQFTQEVYGELKAVWQGAQQRNAERQKQLRAEAQEVKSESEQLEKISKLFL